MMHDPTCDRTRAPLVLLIGSALLIRSLKKPRLDDTLV
jgi:hypothetical protein